MFYTYAIKSETKNYIYVGITNNLDRRFNEHNKGLNRTTKPYAPFKLLHFEEFESRQESRNRELFLKSGSGKEFLKSLIC